MDTAHQEFRDQLDLSVTLESLTTVRIPLSYAVKKISAELLIMTLALILGYVPVACFMFLTFEDFMHFGHVISDSPSIRGTLYIGVIVTSLWGTAGLFLKSPANRLRLLLWCILPLIWGFNLVMARG